MTGTTHETAHAAGNGPPDGDSLLSPRFTTPTRQGETAGASRRPDREQPPKETGGLASSDGAPAVIETGGGPPTVPPTAEIAWAVIGKPDDFRIDSNGCWIWQLKIGRGGYGRCRREGRDGGTQSAHRWYWERLIGPIPAGAFLDHLCRNRACVNPAHLEPVTHVENCRRGAKAKITAAQAEEIRGSREPNRVLATRHGISTWNVEKIKSGARWSA